MPRSRDDSGRYSATVTDQALLFLLTTPHTRHELAAVLGLTPEAVHVRLLDLERRGRVVRLRGEYHDRDEWLAK